MLKNNAIGFNNPFSSFLLKDISEIIDNIPTKGIRIKIVNNT
jgi:hypothetical protein